MCWVDSDVSTDEVVREVAFVVAVSPEVKPEVDARTAGLEELPSSEFRSVVDDIVEIVDIVDTVEVFDVLEVDVLDDAVVDDDDVMVGVVVVAFLQFTMLL